MEPKTESRTLQADNAPENRLEFAAEHSSEPLWLPIILSGAEGSLGGLVPELKGGIPGCELKRAPGAGAPAQFLVYVPGSSPDAEDDEHEFLIQGAGIKPHRVLLRRSSCAMEVALLDHDPNDAETGADDPDDPLWPQTRAALLWYAWKRYRSLTVIKRFTTGKSGSDVLAVRPRLRQPKADHGPGSGTIGEGWGTCLLVKTGDERKVQGEWDRFRTLLTDRLHPFMARSEAFLTARPARVASGGGPTDAPASSGPGSLATLVGSFVGGALVHAAPLESFVRGSEGAEPCLDALKSLFQVLEPWYEDAGARRLGDWPSVFHYEEGRLHLFGKYDLSQRATLERYSAALYWDINLVKSDHLHRHLLGKDPKQRRGLLHRLEEIPVRFSLVHGDLQPRNALVDRQDVWLIDFAESGVAPTLSDFARLEVYLRLWCLDLDPASRDLPATAARFERLLLDIMTGGEWSLDPVREMASGLGADPRALHKIAHCIAWIRRRAEPYGVGGPDRRDYLAVLYLTLFQAVGYAANEPARSRNYDLLVALFWLLEDVLSRVVKLKPYARHGRPLEYKALIEPRWLEAPMAPARVAYMMARRDGRRALPQLAATRGVMQNQTHHLDVFDHTLVVLAGIEELLADPLGCLLDPPGFQGRRDDALHRLGLFHESLASTAPETQRPDLSAVDGDLDELRKRLEEALDRESRLLLKWLALLHDVGKPATRRMVRHSPASRTRPVFFGHEYYALHLLGDLTEHLFPDRDVRVRFANLVQKHHLHHSLLGNTEEAGRWERLAEGLKHREDLANEELARLAEHTLPGKKNYDKDFPLLVLHGFADVAACRGPQSTTPLHRVAELDLMLLAVWVRRPEFERRATVKEQCRALSRQVAAESKLEGKARGKLERDLMDWCLASAGSNGDSAPEGRVPTIGEMKAHASISFDYGAVDWQFLSRILSENSRRLSRTHSGVSDTSTSPQKRPLLLDGDRLRARVNENEARVHQLIYRTRHDGVPRDAQEVLSLLWTIADTINDGLLPTSERLRSWPVPHRPDAPASRPPAVSPEELPAAMERFAEAILGRWHATAGDPVALAAWAEWELNGGPLHPFYDGCGRISRCFGALLLVRGGCLLPLYEDRETYFAHGHRGADAFGAYVRHRIACCAEWLKESPR